MLGLRNQRLLDVTLAVSALEVGEHGEHAAIVLGRLFDFRASRTRF